MFIFMNWWRKSIVCKRHRYSLMIVKMLKNIYMKKFFEINKVVHFLRKNRILWKKRHLFFFISNCKSRFACIKNTHRVFEKQYYRLKIIIVSYKQNIYVLYILCKSLNRIYTFIYIYNTYMHIYIHTIFNKLLE